MQSDVIVIGGGLIGCSIAIELAKKGLKVSVFERSSQLMKEASWAAAGMLAPQSELSAITPMFLLCQKSLQLYQNFVNELEETTKLDCAYRREGFLQLAFDEESAKNLDKNMAWQIQAGLRTEKLTHDDVKKLSPNISDKVSNSYYLRDEHQIDNRKLTNSILAMAEILEVRFFLGSQVTEICVEQNKILGIIANGERHFAAKVVNAAGSWASLLSLPKYFLPDVKPVRGQMLALKTDVGVLEHTLHFGTTYLVPRRDGKIVIGSTTEHVGYDKRVTAQGLEHLLSQAQKIVPKLAEACFLEAWAGFRPATLDLLPILGEHPQLPGLIFATGHYRNGILLTPVTSSLITNLIITGQESDMLTAFSPTRFISTAKAS
ncbi:MAG: glycine oxidase ThiO [Acidobacteria bacterium]|nr:glycine oxidase ThiO [Acidobacteriota bacterium]